MKRDWYVIHVLTGSEAEILRELQRRGFTALVPREERLIRSRGRWNSKEYCLFPGYVFVSMWYQDKDYYSITQVPGVIGILPKDKPMPITYRESKWLRKLGAGVLKPSEVLFGLGEPEILNGPLQYIAGKVVKFDRHRRRALVDVPVLDEVKQIELSIIPVDPGS